MSSKALAKAQDGMPEVAQEDQRRRRRDACFRSYKRSVGPSQSGNPQRRGKQTVLPGRNNHTNGPSSVLELSRKHLSTFVHRWRTDYHLAAAH